METDRSRKRTGNAATSWPMSFQVFDFALQPAALLLIESRPASVTSLFKRLMEVLTVLKLVSIPPNQR
jgi:hypothetical protein